MVLGETYVSYSFVTTSTPAYYGLLSISGSQATVVYSYVDSLGANTFNVSQPYTWPFDQLAGESFDLVVTTGQGTVTVTFNDRRGVDNPFDGTWVGLNLGCYHTLQFNRGVYSVYVSGCGNSNQAILGTYDYNSTHVITRLAYTPQQPGLKDLELTQAYTVAADGLSMSVVTVGNTVITYYKADVPPSARRVTIHLDADFDTWDQAKQDAYVAALAAAIGVEIGNIEVVGFSKGSVILDAITIDDQVSGTSAHDIFTSMQAISGTSIGGYTSTVSDPDAGSSSGGGGSGGAHAAPSLLAMAFLAVAAALAHLFSA